MYDFEKESFSTKGEYQLFQEELEKEFLPEPPKDIFVNFRDLEEN